MYNASQSFLFSLSVVNKLSQGGEDDLEEMRKKVHTLAEDTAIALKKNVYKNYSQFIETAKEISSILVKNSVSVLLKHYNTKKAQLLSLQGKVYNMKTSSLVNKSIPFSSRVSVYFCVGPSYDEKFTRQPRFSYVSF